MQLISNKFINSKKVLNICILSFTLLLNFETCFGQVNWELKKSVLKVPDGFKDWIIRNVGSFDANNAAIGSIIGTNQHTMYVDFNKEQNPQLWDTVAKAGEELFYENESNWNPDY